MMVIAMVVMHLQTDLRTDAWGHERWCDTGLFMPPIMGAGAIFVMRTSEPARCHALRLRRLADGLIAAQRREIEEMDRPGDDIGGNGGAGTEAEAAARPIAEFQANP
ncbi:MAG: hypothetical protein R3229_15690 [Alphaproteobacteria bacterium]|nr:hypothetical protein [Alphaproteobacteria bacterium]